MYCNYDQFIAALCLWREARNCSPQAMTGVWWVLINRVRDPKKRWPDSIHGCIFQPHQFSSFNPDNPNCSKFPTMANPTEWVKFQQCLDVVSVSLGGDPTGGANHYENCEPGHLPVWADPHKITAIIGPFRFYHL